MSNNEKNKILDRYLTGQSYPGEEQLVKQWLDDLANDSNEWQVMSQHEKVKYLAALYNDIRLTIQKSNAPVFQLYQKKSFWWASAAVIIFLFVGLGTYFLMHQTDVTMEAANNTGDIAAPTTAKAMITLADGKLIALDSLETGVMVLQGGTKLIKNASGEIIYQAADKNFDYGELYHTLSNPRGSTVVTFALADGTKVWLNSESSIRYPVIFKGTERKVEITGEAYFEVAHNKSMPFKVIKDEVEVTVIGTHFNVNAYSDEKTMKITLLEGSVKVTKGKINNILKPGEQAEIADNIILRKEVDPVQVIAWKDGLFIMNNTDIEAIMKQISRWYDVKVIYKGNVETDNFSGTIPRSLGLAEMMRVLEIIGIQYDLEGRNLIISSPK